MFKNTIYLISLILLGCKWSNNKSPEFSAQVNSNIENVINNSKPGDLVVRLGDDFTSDRIRYMNDKDKSYSHAGIITMYNNEKVICHILPDPSKKGGDSVAYTSIKSFYDIKHNVKGAWYRYNFTKDEKNIFISELDSFHNKKVIFDLYYDSTTNDQLYCSEMIDRALVKATNERIKLKYIPVSKSMIPILTSYFKNLGASHDTTEKVVKLRRFVSIDNLYLNENCKLMSSFDMMKFENNTTDVIPTNPYKDEKK